eukprot:TRINITY_DN11678_c0_g1_i3.p1 TRINITY_DN11678_c0_g1~~TRINITY_DN11678_c0_g1_i3.p1  ORF type:complete len:179 (+),score=47.71 TRINITY_DN11678_c0_g1_i3:146-682(+)
MCIRDSCAEFGANLVSATHSTTSGKAVFRFPSLNQIGTMSEQRLLEIGWGYRAARLVRFATELTARGGVEWLEQLRKGSLDEARSELQGLCGVGPKVADCICLFGLGKHEVVVLDTHCRQMCCRPDLPWCDPELCQREAKNKRAVRAKDHLRVRSRFWDVFGRERACLLYTSPSPRDS